MAGMYRDLGKEIIGLCDKQDAATETSMLAALDLLLMHDENGFEKMILAGSTEAAMTRYIDSITWPQALHQKIPDPKADVPAATLAYLSKYKGEGVAADFLVQCEFDEIPQWIKASCLAIQQFCNDAQDEPEPPAPAAAAEPESA
jgi:putative ATP-dependent endonuclease of OLD family